MESVRVDEHRGLAVEKVTNGAAFEREVGVALERHDGREVQPSLEPWLHLVKTPTLDLEGAQARKHPEMIIHRLADHDARGMCVSDHRLPVIENRCAQEHDGHTCDCRDQRWAPPAPVRASLEMPTYLTLSRHGEAPLLIVTKSHPNVIAVQRCLTTCRARLWSALQAFHPP